MKTQDIRTVLISVDQKRQSVIALFFFFFSLLLSQSLFAQQTEYPRYPDQSLPKPSGLKTFTGNDFQPDIGRLDLYPEGFL